METKKSTKVTYKKIKSYLRWKTFINKILVSKKVLHSKEKNSCKHYIGYNDDDDDDVIRSLCIKLPQMIGYVKHFNNNNDINKTMSFSATNDRLLKQYTQILEKVSNLMGIESDSEPVYVDKYIKPKIRSYGGDITTNCQKNEVQEKAHHGIAYQ